MSLFARQQSLSLGDKSIHPDDELSLLEAITVDVALYEMRSRRSVRRSSVISHEEEEEALHVMMPEPRVTR